VTDEIVNGKVLDSQPGVVLDQLARYLMEEGSAGIRNVSVLACKLSCGLGVVTGSALSSRQGARAAPKSAKPARERIIGRPAPNLSPVRSCCDSECEETPVYPDEPTTLTLVTRLMTAPRMEVRRLDIETHIPAGTAPSYGGEEDLGPPGGPSCARNWIDLRVGTKETPDRSSVVMDPDPPDLGQGDRPRMSLPDSEQVASARCLLRSRKLSRQRPLRLRPGKPTRRPARVPRFALE
jgi:hypothetical protein